MSIYQKLASDPIQHAVISLPKTISLPTTGKYNQPVSLRRKNYINTYNGTTRGKMQISPSENPRICKTKDMMMKVLGRYQPHSLSKRLSFALGSGIISTESTTPDKRNQNIDTLVGDDEDRNVAS
jgi:hypothetical protein